MGTPFKMKGFSGFGNSPMKNGKTKIPSLPPKKLPTLPGELDSDYSKKMEPTKPTGKPGKKYGKWIGELD